jgi:peptide/nickel transport system substrate-binding protein
MPGVIGSGPFRFVADEWVPNALAVYEKFEDYVPRSEPPDMFSGGKNVYVDRVEAPYIADVQTNLAALQAGEIDYTVNTQYDLLPILEADPNVTTAAHDDTGLLGIIRLNHLHPPFDDPRAREAMQWLVDQKQYLHAIAGSENYYATCAALFGCGTVNGSEGNSERLMEHNLDRARQLFEEAGYDGRPIVILHRIDHPREKGAGEVTAQLLRQAGVNVDLQEMDWGTVTTRRAMVEPPAEGGWNIFHTAGAGIVMDDPLFILNRTSCDNAWYGWPCDEEYEKLAAAYADATSPEESLGIAEQMQNRGMDVVVQIPYGTLFAMVAYRAELEGVLNARGGYPLWNIRKK